MNPAADLDALAKAFGLSDGRAVAEHWQAAFVHYPAIAAHLRGLADAPTAFPSDAPLDPLQMAHQAGGRDLALALLRVMQADHLDIEAIFQSTGNPPDE